MENKQELRDLIKRGCRDMDLDDFLAWEIYKDFLRRVSVKKEGTHNGERK